MKAFFGITVPMMANGILRVLLCPATIITELSTAIILYNLKTVTLTLAVYTYVSRGNYGIAAAYANLNSGNNYLTAIVYVNC